MNNQRDHQMTRHIPTSLLQVLGIPQRIEVDNDADAIFTIADALAFAARHFKNESELVLCSNDGVVQVNLQVGFKRSL